MPNDTSTSPLIVNTSSFCEEDLIIFLECSERIQESEQRQRRESLKRATKTREGVFESSVISTTDRTDDNLLNDYPSYVSKSASMNDLLKYFEEDVEVHSDPQQQDANKSAILPPYGQVVVERSVRTSEVKQTDMKSAQIEKKNIAENFIKNYGAKPNVIVNAASDGKPKCRLPLSEIKQTDLQFFDIEPSLFKPNDGDACLKPSDLISKRLRSNELKMRPSTPTDLPQADDSRKSIALSASALRRKVFNLSDLEYDPKPSVRKLRCTVPGEFEAEALKCGLKPRIKCGLISNVKRSDRNLTQSKWEARYSEIIKNLRPNGPTASPFDLNLTQQQWDERSQITRNDLKPVDLSTPPKMKPPQPQDQRLAKLPAPKMVDATKARKEVLESVISRTDRTDDNLLKDDPSYVSKSASINDLLKYFEEDVEVHSDPQQQNAKKSAILPRYGEVVVERSVRPNEVKQIEMKSAQIEKKNIAENIIRNYGAKPNASVNAASDGKPNCRLPLSENKQTDLQFIDIEPSVFKPNAGDACLKPSDLKAKGLRSNELKMRSSTPMVLPQADDSRKSIALHRKFVKLSDLEDDPKPSVRKVRFAVPGELEAEAFKGGLKPRIKCDLISNVKLSDHNLTQSEWEARYSEIIKNDLRNNGPTASPFDLNLTQQQWDERYFQITRNDLKPVDVLTPPKMKTRQPQCKHQAKPPAPNTAIKSKVQKMADMFNGMTSQVMKRQPAIAYATLNNELLPEPPQPRAHSVTTSIRKSPVPSPIHSKRTIQEAGCLISDEVFTKHSVKDKVLLFNKFMREMTRMNPDFSNNLPEDVKALAENKILSEKQESVKSLARELEGNITIPKQTVSEAAVSKLRRVPSKKGPVLQPPLQMEKKKKTQEVADKEEQIDVSTLTVVLKPSPGKPCSTVDLEKETKLRGLPGFRRRVTSTVVACPSKKRRSSIPIDFYCSPRKIRRTEPDITISKKVFRNPYLKQMFYDWMNLHGLSDNVEATAPAQEVVQEDANKTDEADKIVKNEYVDAPKEEIVKADEPPRAYHLKNKKADSQKKNKQPEKPPRALFKSDSPESDSSLMTMPSSKITTDDSQTDQPKESPEEFPLSTTDSDSDCKQLAQLAQQQKPKKPVDQVDLLNVKNIISKGLAPARRQQSFDVDFMNSWRKIQNAYTLTVITSPSQSTESVSSMTSDEPPKPPYKQKPQLPHAIDEAIFENEFSPVSVISKSATKSPAMEKSPLFIKMKTELERCISEANQNPSAYSTPVKDDSDETKTTPVKKSSWHTVLSPIQLNRRRSLNDWESRRSSILMEVIREEDHDPESHQTKPDIEDEVFQPSPPSIDEGNDKTSSFWITVGEFTISMAIFESPSDNLHLLYNVFILKSAEVREVRFGVDDFKYSSKDGITKEEITKSFPKIVGISHYWVATGDLVVPFQGNFMAPDKINRTFSFIRESVSDYSQLSFGVDAYEFSQIADPMSPNFSIESSMLIELNGQRSPNDTRNFTWPSDSQSSTTVNTSKFDRNLDSDCIDRSEIGRLSFSPYGSNYLRSGERTSISLFESQGSPEMLSS